MNILFVTYDLPYPLDSGGKIRAYHLMKALSKAHHVYCISFIRANEQTKYVEKLNFCKDVRTVLRDTPYSFSNLTKLWKYPIPIGVYDSSQMKQELKNAILAYSIDILHLESFYTSFYTLQKALVCQIIGTENIEWEVYRNYIQMLKNPVMKSIGMLEVNRIKRYELASWNRPDALLAVSPENKKIIEITSSKPVYLIPNGVNTEFFSYHPKSYKQVKKNPVLLFVGNFSYLQNKDSLQWFLTQIIPILPKKWRLLIVGKNLPQELSQLCKTTSSKYHISITHTATVEDIRNSYELADIMIAPIRIGSGTKFKILEAMSYGIPIVGTSIALEGMGIVSGKHALCEDNPQAFVQALVKTLINSKSTMQRTDSARKLVEKDFTWERIGKKLLETYEKAYHNHRKL